MLITSPSFEHNGEIPAKFTCDGGDINPELHIQNIPPSTKSLALIMDDPDSPRGTFTHWVVWNIDPRTETVKQESKPPGSCEGKTDFGRVGYGGPCPGSGMHHYHFKVFALDSIIDLPEGTSRREVEKEIEKHVIEHAELVGLYSRVNR